MQLGNQSFALGTNYAFGRTVKPYPKMGWFYWNDVLEYISRATTAGIPKTIDKTTTGPYNSSRILKQEVTCMQGEFFRDNPDCPLGCRLNT